MREHRMSHGQGKSTEEKAERTEDFKSSLRQAPF